MTSWAELHKWNNEIEEQLKAKNFSNPQILVNLKKAKVALFLFRLPFIVKRIFKINLKNISERQVLAD